MDKVLSLRDEIHSREMARRLIVAGEVRLNGKIPTPSSKVSSEDTIDFSLPPPEKMELIPEKGPLDILFEDAHLIVLNKASGVSMHPGPGHATGTLVHFLLAHCQDLSGIGGVERPGIVHRLDMDTTGVVVVAKSDAAHTPLAEQFKEHTIHRIYQAIVVGHPTEKNGVGALLKGKIDMPLGRAKNARLKQAVNPQGRRAVTRWEVIERLGPFTLMKFRLETGRTHQIRVHAAESGWPVLGDPLYGKRRHRGLQLPPDLEAKLEGFSRQALHAAELGFLHPITGEWTLFSVPLPADMENLVRILKKATPA